MNQEINKLTYKHLGIDTNYEYIAYMREDCHVCISEGFEALTRIKIKNENKTIVANLNVIRSGILKHGEIALSESASGALGVREGEILSVSHIDLIDSLSYIRSKIFGNVFTQQELESIIKDIVQGNLSNIHLAAFITACAGDRLNTKEIIYLTQAMISSGNQLKWKEDLIVDKHCVGGLPGNRTTPIIVSIVTSLGLIMPKTSSRSITSPAGTADTMGVLTNVNLSIEKIKDVIEKEGGCIAWGGAAKLSPADDVLIKVERALDIDSEGQLIASVLSKKIASGSTHVVIDMPVGETAKLRSVEGANKLKAEMEKVADAFGIKLKVLITDGSQPVGRGIGPALEARDILSVLKNEETAPNDLKERALVLAGEIIELSGKAESGQGFALAKEILESGKAYEKFKAICEAQGYFHEPSLAKFQYEIKATHSGRVINIDNRRLAQIAKLAGAPDNTSAGVDFLSPLQKKVEKGQTLYVIHSESQGELDYALEYYRSQDNIITIQ